MENEIIKKKEVICIPVGVKYIDPADVYKYKRERYVVEYCNKIFDTLEDAQKFLSSDNAQYINFLTKKCVELTECIQSIKRDLKHLSHYKDFAQEWKENKGTHNKIYRQRLLKTLQDFVFAQGYVGEEVYQSMDIKTVIAAVNVWKRIKIQSKLIELSRVRKERMYFYRKKVSLLISNGVK